MPCGVRGRARTLSRVRKAAVRRFAIVALFVACTESAPPAEPAPPQPTRCRSDAECGLLAPTCQAPSAAHVNDAAYAYVQMYFATSSWQMADDDPSWLAAYTDHRGVRRLDAHITGDRGHSCDITARVDENATEEGYLNECGCVVLLRRNGDLASIVAPDPGCVETCSCSPHATITPNEFRRAPGNWSSGREPGWMPSPEIDEHVVNNTETTSDQTPSSRPELPDKSAPPGHGGVASPRPRCDRGTCR